jgi:two-component system, OmpR family, response regulator PhoP
MQILVIEDEVALASQIQQALKTEQFVVRVANDGDEGYYQATEFPVDCAIIDLGLPGKSGLEIIHDLRQNGFDFPILILTARGHWQDKVAGLAKGADDYLVKPFHMEELLARMNALIRRSSGFASPELSIGTLVLNTLEKSISINKQRVDITAYEYKILEYMMLKPGQVISKTELTEHVYEQDFERDSNVIEVLVGRLRKKLDPDGVYKPIETLRGRGYRINQEVQ